MSITGRELLARSRARMTTMSMDGDGGAEERLRREREEKRKKEQAERQEELKKEQQAQKIAQRDAARSRQDDARRATQQRQKETADSAKVDSRLAGMDHRYSTPKTDANADMGGNKTINAASAGVKSDKSTRTQAQRAVADQKRAEEKEEKEKTAAESTPLTGQALLEKNKNAQIGRTMNNRISNLATRLDNVYADYNSRFFDEDGKFVGKIAEDNAAANENFLSTRDKITNSWSVIQDYIKANPDAYSEDEVAYLEELFAARVERLSDIGQAYEFYAGFSTQEDYDNYVASVKKNQELSIMDLEAAKARVSALEKQLYAYEKSGNTKLMQSEVERARAQIERLQASIAAREPLFAKADAVQTSELAALNDADQKKIATYENFLRQMDPAYVQQLQAELSTLRADIVTATRMQTATELERVKESAGYQQYISRFDDMTDASIQVPEGWQVPGTEEEDGWTLVGVLKDATAWSNDAAHTLTVDGKMSAKQAVDEVLFWDSMTEDERSVYSYYKHTGQNDKATAYADAIAERVNQRTASEIYDKLKDRTMMELLFGAAVGLDQFVSGLKKMGNDTPSAPSYMEQASGMVREDLADNGPKLPEWLGGASLGQIAYDTVTTTANMLPSILASTMIAAIPVVGQAAAPIVGSALMGASSAGHAKDEMLRLGYDEGQAAAYGALVGGSEAVLGYFLGGIGKLGGKAVGKLTGKALTQIDNALARTAIKLGGSMLSEGLEEGLQEILDPWFAEVVTGADFDSPETGEVLYSSLMGAISAGMLEGPGVIRGGIAEQQAKAQVYKEMGNKLSAVDGGVARLVELGQLQSADSVAHKLADKVNDKTGAYTIGRLLYRVGGTLSEQNRADLTRSLTRKGMRARDAKINVEWMAKVAEGVMPTEAQKAALEGNEVLSKTFQDIIINPYSTVWERMRPYRSLVSQMTQNAATDAKTGTVDGESGTAAESMTAESTSVRRPKVTEPMAVRDTEGELSSVVRVADVRDGHVKVELSDGRVVDATAGEISHTDATRDDLYGMLGQLRGVNGDGATGILRAFDDGSGTSVRDYVTDVPLAYAYGRIGDRASLSKLRLSENQAATAYTMGHSARMREVKARVETRKEQSYEGRATEQASAANQTGRVIYEGFDPGKSTLTAMQKASVAGAEALAKLSSLEIHVYRSEVGKNGERVIRKNGKWQSAPNGYIQSGNKLYLDLNAGEYGEGTMLYTMAHEVTHYIAQNAPENFWEIGEYVVSHFGKSGADVSELIEAQKKNVIKGYELDGRKLPSDEVLTDEAYEEVIADAMSAMLSDPRAYEKLMELKKSDRTLFQKLGDAIRHLLDKLRSLLHVYEGREPGTREQKYMAEMTRENYERLQNLYLSAFVEADKNYSAGRTEKNIDTIKYSVVNSGTFGENVKNILRMSDEEARQNASEGNYVKIAGGTPEIMLRHMEGAENLDVIIRFDALYLATREGGALKGHYHGLGYDVMSRLNDYISDPLAIVRMDNGRYNLFAQVDSKNKNGIISMEINTVKDINSKYKKYNLVVTVFSAKDNYVNNLLQKHGEKVTYKKDGLEQVNRQLYEWLAIVSNHPSVNSISQNDGDVNTSGEKNKYSMRQDAQQYSYETLTAKPDITVTRLPKNVPNNRADVIVEAKKRAAKIGVFHPLSASVRVRVKDMGRDVILSTGGLRHSLDRRFQINAPVVVNAGEILQNSICINELHARSKESTGGYVLIGVAQGEKERYIVRSIVNQYTNEVDTIDVLYAIGAKKESGALLPEHADRSATPADSFYPDNGTGKTAPDGTGGNMLGDRSGDNPQGSADVAAASLSDHTISIAQLLDDVNRYFPDVLSEDVLEHYGETTRPSGVLSDSVKYSMRRLQSGESNRSLLLGVLEQENTQDNTSEYTMTSKQEHTLLLEYAKKAAALDSLLKQLDGVRREIRDASFSSGEKDGSQKALIPTTSLVTGKQAAAMSAMEDLRLHERELVRKLDEGYAELLRLENNDILRAVLSREKRRLRQEENERGKAKLNEWRTARSITASKEGIKRVVGRLNTKLLHGGKTRHVPIELQKPVAIAMSIFFGDDADRVQGRIANIDERLEREQDETVRDALIGERERLQTLQNSNGDLLVSLQGAYAAFLQSDDPMVRDAHDTVIADRIAQAAEKIGSTPVKNMSLAQLETVRQLFTMIEHRVSQANETFAEGQRENIKTLAEHAMEEIKSVKVPEMFRSKDEGFAVFNRGKEFLWNNLKPRDFFELLGSETLFGLYDRMHRGEMTYFEDIYEAKQAWQAATKKHHYYDWDWKTRKTYEDSNSGKISLSLDERLTLYSWFMRQTQISEHKQALQHLENGGFQFEQGGKVTDSKLPGRERRDATNHPVDELRLKAILADLTPEQIAFADEMLAYSTKLSDKLNEVSLRLYGVKLFGGENHYIKIESAKTYTETRTGEDQGFVSLIKNKGMTKTVNKESTNPIILRGFADTMIAHFNEVALYHGMVPACEDLSRVLNYSISPKTKEDGTPQKVKDGGDHKPMPLKQVMAEVYGMAPEKYIRQLLVDINGGMNASDTMSGLSRLFGTFKKVSTMASLSVVLQQYSSLPRAWSMIDPKYFVGWNKAKLVERWEELRRYAPVAIAKDIGGFDTGTGKRTASYINAREYTGMRKLGAFFTDGNYRDEILGSGAARADRVTWCRIWDAVKREQLDIYNAQHADAPLTPEQFSQNEALMEKAGERFDEVIVRTQVYDSVLTRSAHMRSKNPLAQMSTAFMAEPTTITGMLTVAMARHARGERGVLGRTVGSIFVSTLCNAMLGAVAYAMRDDDEDKSLSERYLNHVVEGLIDGMNPMNLYPIARDVMSLLQGYDIERSDMSVIADFIQTAQRTWNVLEGEEPTAGEIADAMINLFSQAGSLAGIPTRNIVRELRAVMNTGKGLIAGERVTGEGVWLAVRDALPYGDANAKSNEQQLYEAVLSGDRAHYNRVSSRYKNQKAVDSALRTALRKNDERIERAARARIAGELATYTKLAKEIIAEGHFSQDIVVGAITNEATILKSKMDAGVDDETAEKVESTSIYRASDVMAAFDAGNDTDARKIIEDLVRTKVSNGTEVKAARSSVRSSMTSYYKEKYCDAYLAKDERELKRIRNILYKSGLYGSGDEVVATVRSWLRQLSEEQKKNAKN